MQFDAKKPSYLSDSYWARLSQADQALHLLVNPMPEAAYTVDWPLKSPAEVVCGWAQC